MTANLNTRNETHLNDEELEQVTRGGALGGRRDQRSYR